MKLRIFSICLSILMLAGLAINNNDLRAEESAVGFNAGISYSSAYFWRGTEIDAGEGVFWPSIGMDVAGISFGISAGIDAAYFTVSDSDSDKANKPLWEVDYSASYGIEIGKIASLGVGVLYAQYPFYDEVDKNADDASFIEGSLSLGLNVPLSPSVEFYYDYFVQDDTDDTPTDEDYYLKFSLSHDLVSSDTLTVSLGAWAGYYKNAYFEAEGWSDAGVSLSTSQSYKDVSFDSAFNYARSLSKDFQGTDENYKNHFWVDFGISKSF